MRTRLANILTITAIITFVALGCGDSDTEFEGSSTWIQSLTIGDIPIKVGQTVNVPLREMSKIRIELSKPVTIASLNELMDFRITIRNLDKNLMMTFTDGMLHSNGDLVWVGDSNTILEYRLARPFHLLPAGSYFMSQSSPGNKFKVKIDFALFKLENGNNAQLIDEEFYIVWTESSQGPIVDDDYTAFGTLFNAIYIGDVPVKRDETVNVPLSGTSKIRFELARPVSKVSVGLAFNFSLRITNLDTGEAYVLTESMLGENGILYWVGEDNLTIEYRMNHSMKYVLIGGQPYQLGNPGDKLRIQIDDALVMLQDGSLFYMRGDKFDVVWVTSPADT
ncbi:MAG TPA: hypothetical protein ENN67_01935 [Firmicutes bacterium]|nr:hypothetical protein [Bacillota bacterium]